MSFSTVDAAWIWNSSSGCWDAEEDAEEDDEEDDDDEEDEAAAYERFCAVVDGT
jgi:hypothetical protein